MHDVHLALCVAALHLRRALANAAALQPLCITGVTMAEERVISHFAITASEQGRSCLKELPAEEKERGEKCLDRECSVGAV